MTEPQARSYRFGVRDRAGWLLGLNASQCIALAVGVLIAGVLLNLDVVPLLVLVPLAIAGSYAFAPAGAVPAHELVPVAIRWAGVVMTGRRRWFPPLPRFHGDASRVATQAPWPPSLSGLTIVETVEADWTRRGRLLAAAAVRDPRERWVSASLVVEASAFTLCERPEQDRLLHGWGDVLSGFCSERRSVARVRWCEWSAPAGLEQQMADVDRRSTGTGSARDDYEGLLKAAGPAATKHELLMTVTVDERRVRARRGESVDRRILAERVLFEEVRLLTARLEAAGLRPHLPLDPQETAGIVRRRLDPHEHAGRPEPPGLAGHAGLVSAANANPMGIDASWGRVQVGRSWHAAYVICEWPRLEVPANWMEHLLLHAGGIRTVTVHYEPVAPTRSHRRVDRDAVKLISDKHQRQRSGFRTGARHSRAEADVRDRETELVAGYAELEFTGFVIISADEPDTLEASCSEYEQVAAQCGLELRRLDGRHDLALPCLLPVGRGLARRWF